MSETNTPAELQRNLQSESGGYAGQGRERFIALLNSDRPIDSREIEQFIQMIAMDFFIKKHRDEIRQDALGKPTILLPEETFFSENFAARFDIEFLKDDGELSAVKNEIFSKRNANGAIKKLEVLMEQWWHEREQNEAV
ncbi:MAG: hypothetical protein CO029_04725 [Candidatus Magasanikbacteria bacterium CG_4_9_14_0_2_um_filter_41_10]|uniref:Uncharacterized protein n=1 Tax=Candidatus Magasanikbacteria bacterium CG_4_10_14_0_2_um_filter_41_31 TaxID=1974639 RepID=A0A2M7V5S1_9BACT|nr:MAG: hypothetical protein AUJ37_02760 [Candidatus Magasanikbacteria bacterium CG1_02_41_34]PIZ93937.1 MAG: hypothetical protein COX83_00645 [Candidatus Magasanikbacteria bacterium CG_4_10_14_0_2_um_filter_41_31]PJC53055.1 MAG: hypothetical protein CO029_04725 [Candidatus Magasanikbacteria bacterium CG_4_9_14_0_2_um_filter_41_10]